MVGHSTEMQRKPSAAETNSKKRAFITAPASTDVSVIRQLLAEHGISTITWEELDRSGTTLADILREAIARADYVLAVLNGGSANENILYELGFAQALQKPTLLIVSSNEPLPALATTGIPYLRASPTNRRALDYGLVRFIKAPRHGQNAAPMKAAAQTRALGAVVDELLARLRKAKGAATETLLIDVIAQAIRRSGVSALSDQVHESGADLAVWSDDWEPWVSNPLLVEVKSRVRSKSEAQALADRVDRTVGSARPTSALLIYGDASTGAIDALSKGSLLAISAEEFLEGLRTTSIGELVRGMRNARAHGR